MVSLVCGIIIINAWWQLTLKNKYPQLDGFVTYKKENK